MKTTFAVIAAAVLAAPLAAAPVVRTGDGYQTGTSKAPHSLVVVSSYGCPHCADLEKEGAADLQTRVARGALTMTYVPYVMFPYDLPATLLAECGTDARFFDRTKALFAYQTAGNAKWSKLTQDQKITLQKTPKAAQAKALYDAYGMAAILPELGLTPAAAAQCLAGETKRAALLETTKAVDAKYKVQGTPTILLDGAPTGTGGSWTALKAHLDQVR